MTNYECENCGNIFSDKGAASSGKLHPDTLDCPCCGKNTCKTADDKDETVEVLSPYDYDWINYTEHVLLTSAK